MPSWEFSFCFFISCPYICTCLRRHLKEPIPSSSITWSEMENQTIQAKQVYYNRFRSKRRHFLAKKTLCKASSRQGRKHLGKPDCHAWQRDNKKPFKTTANATLNVPNRCVFADVLITFCVIISDVIIRR